MIVTSRLRTSRTETWSCQTEEPMSPSWPEPRKVHDEEQMASTRFRINIGAFLKLHIFVPYGPTQKLDKKNYFDLEA